MRVLPTGWLKPFDYDGTIYTPSPSVSHGLFGNRLPWQRCRPSFPGNIQDLHIGLSWTCIFSFLALVNFSSSSSACRFVVLLRRPLNWKRSSFSAFFPLSVPPFLRFSFFLFRATWCPKECPQEVPDTYCTYHSKHTALVKRNRHKSISSDSTWNTLRWGLKETVPLIPIVVGLPHPSVSFSEWWNHPVSSFVA